jgi:hypothetical protein
MRDVALDDAGSSNRNRWVFESGITAEPTLKKRFASGQGTGHRSVLSMSDDISPGTDVNRRDFVRAGSVAAFFAAMGGVPLTAQEAANAEKVAAGDTVRAVVVLLLVVVCVCVCVCVRGVGGCVSIQMAGRWMRL